MTMLDVLHRLEKLKAIESVDAWDKPGEIRNAITHQHLEELQIRLDNV